MDFEASTPFHDTFDNLIDDLQTVAFAQGFGFRKLRNSNPSPEGYTLPGTPYLRYDLVCVCQGKPPALKPNRQRKERASMKTNCPCKVKAVWRKDIALWELTIMERHHNHEPHEKPEDFCAHRRRLRRSEASFEAQLEKLSLTGKSTAPEIANQLEECFRTQRGDENIRITAKDVLNAQDNLIKRKYGPYTSTQLFLEVLETKEDVVFHGVDRDKNGRIISVFWTYATCLDQWKRNPELLSFDNTYKVNRFNMPLLQITGITTLHTVFNAAFCLVSSEDEEAFAWPLGMLRTLAEKEKIPLPGVILSDFSRAFKNAADKVLSECQQQLCLWHILKNVQHYARTHWNGPIIHDEPQGNDDEIEELENLRFDRLFHALEPPMPSPGQRKFEDSPDGFMQAWKVCTNTSTEEAFWKAFNFLRGEFSNQNRLLEYLEKQYIPYRHQFVQYSTQMFKNFGIRSTSPTEGSHASLKKNMRNRLISLFQLERSIAATLADKQKKFNSQLAKEKIFRLQKYARIPLFSQICTQVSFKALELLYEQYLRAYEVYKHRQRNPPPSLPRCTSGFWLQMGLPCQHKILERLEIVGPLQLEDCDHHWHLRDIRVCFFPRILLSRISANQNGF